MENVKEIGECLCCGSKDLETFLSMGDQPPCNRLVKADEPDPPFFPLNLNWCHRCLHQQLTHAVDSDLLFSRYPYRTGYSQSHVLHFNYLAQHCKRLFPLETKLKVADIGSNDGTLLSFFKGWHRTAIDPYVVPNEGTAELHWDARWDREIEDPNMKGVFDLITATNVLAHNPNPRQFISNCYASLKEGGYLVVESPCSFELLKNLRFDTIYHEHLSYFNVSSMSALLSLFPLETIAIDCIEGHHGETVRFTIKKNKDSERSRTLPPAQQSRVDIYSAKGIYKQFADRVARARETLIDHIVFSRDVRGRKVIGFGASAKAVTLINFFGLQSKPDFILDETPGKANMLTPKSRVPIKSYEEEKKLFDNNAEALFLMYTWNCYDESIQKLQSFATNQSKRFVYHYGMDNAANF